MAEHGSPADRGSADAYYWRAPRPHKRDGFKTITDLTEQERAEYMAAHNAQEDRKEWD